MEECGYGINSRLTIFTGKYGYLLDGPQDGAYVPSDNSNDPGGNQVPGLEQHMDGLLHIYSPVLLIRNHRVDDSSTQGQHCCTT